MRLSESLRKNIMETYPGFILNKLNVRNRRNVIFPESILAAYVKECENAGFGKDIKNISRE